MDFFFWTCIYRARNLARGKKLSVYVHMMFNTSPMIYHICTKIANQLFYNCLIKWAFYLQNKGNLKKMDVFFWSARQFLAKWYFYIKLKICTANTLKITQKNVWMKKLNIGKFTSMVLGVGGGGFASKKHEFFDICIYFRHHKWKGIYT